MDNFAQVFSFVLPTKIVFGIDSLQHLGEELHLLGGKHPLIVTDAGIVYAGILQKVLDALPENFTFSIFDGVEANPKDTDVEAGASMYRNHTCDCLLAIGGGSPIDCAKAIGVLIANEASDIRAFEGKNADSKPIPPLLCIPTTSGTGSELTFSSVITDTSRQFKMTIKNAYTAPRVAICDPVLTMTVPAHITAATGMDALTHAIEAYVATCSEPISDAVALYAIELINANLVDAFTDGNNLHARSRMLMGSMLAGIAFSHSDVASVHCIAEALGGLYDLAHGVCNAVILPHMMEYNLDYSKGRFARIAAAMGAPSTLSVDEAALFAVARTKELAQLVQLPAFADLGVKPEDFPRIASASAANISTQSNPRPMNETDYLAVLNKMAQ